MDPLVYFMVTMVSLAVIHSMIYNSRRLETIGYALSVAFLQQLINGDEDIFLICSQFPIYVSPKDKDPNPDTTMPDAEARGVYVDHALLLPRAQSQALTGFSSGSPPEPRKFLAFPSHIVHGGSSSRGEKTGSYPPSL